MTIKSINVLFVRNRFPGAVDELDQKTNTGTRSILQDGFQLWRGNQFVRPFGGGDDRLFRKQAVQFLKFRVNLDDFKKKKKKGGGWVHRALALICFWMQDRELAPPKSRAL